MSGSEIETLVAQGYEVLDRQQIELFDGTFVRFRIRPDISLEAARAEVAAAGSNTTADFNQFYRTSASGTSARSGAASHCAGPGCAARNLIGWPVLPAHNDRCGSGIRIGLIDTGINPDHAAFTGGRLEVIENSIAGQRQSARRHGTAVASILIGSAKSRAPGLLPNATVLAVDAFYRGKGNDERSDAYTLVTAIDLVRQRNVRIINISLAGPPNLLLERMLAGLKTEGVIVVAAAGNQGPKAAPAYPAAYPGVIAVTAVDNNRRVYRRAGRGEHIDIAEPGVGVWIAASVRGAKFATGTSYAVPFTTAAIALVLQDLDVSDHDQVVAALANRAIDIGEPGRDEIYGHGLLQVTGLCD
ncbi:MAG: S8 family serine peptidase [Hyphomicrobiales bacterium]|nr:S8 family serine peptidase [Hyphomicrobiales bacterium]MCP4998523.1 S8 family serine peptidase [Hyphomicrobiales bacterium]